MKSWIEKTKKQASVLQIGLGVDLVVWMFLTFAPLSQSFPSSLNEGCRKDFIGRWIDDFDSIQWNSGFSNCFMQHQTGDRTGRTARRKPEQIDGEMDKNWQKNKNYQIFPNVVDHLLYM